MAKSDRMEKVDMTKEFANLREADKHFIRKLEKMNTDRVKDLKGLKKRNGIVGLLLGGSVLGICILRSSYKTCFRFRFPAFSHLIAVKIFQTSMCHSFIVVPKTLIIN